MLEVGATSGLHPPVKADEEEETEVTVTILHHRVADFDAWKKIYDGLRDAQREGGVPTHSVLRSTDDPNLIVVTHSFAPDHRRTSTAAGTSS